MKSILWKAAKDSLSNSLRGDIFFLIFKRWNYCCFSGVVNVGAAWSRFKSVRFTWTPTVYVYTGLYNWPKSVTRSGGGIPIFSPPPKVSFLKYDGEERQYFKLSRNNFDSSFEYFFYSIQNKLYNYGEYNQIRLYYVIKWDNNVVWFTIEMRYLSTIPFLTIFP